MSERLVVIQADRDAAAEYNRMFPELRLTEAFARHRHDHTADLLEVLERADKFITDFFAPWGSWKTAWWEGEVSDDAAFTHDNALKHVANILRPAISRARGTPGKDSGRE